MIDTNKLLLHLDSVNNKTPIVADVMLTNFCNCSCVYCKYKKMHKNNSYIDFERFKLYVNRLKELGVRGIILTGGGEPTVNPDFDKICKWLEENNIEYGINTNFILYKEIKPVYLKVSLDSFNSVNYESVRGVDAFDTVVNNIRKFINYKKSNNLKTAVVVQCVATDCKNIGKFYNAVCNLDVDSIVYRPIESNLGVYYTDDSEHTKIIDKINILMSSDSRVNLSFKWNELSTHFDDCYANFSQIAVDYNGNVPVCCHRPNEIIGNILDDDILTKKNSYNINMNLCDVPCRLTGANKIMEYINKNDGLIDKNFI